MSKIQFHGLVINSKGSSGILENMEDHVVIRFEYYMVSFPYTEIGYNKTEKEYEYK